jgi:hypothetical protein
MLPVDNPRAFSQECVRSARAYAERCVPEIELRLYEKWYDAHSERNALTTRSVMLQNALRRGRIPPSLRIKLAKATLHDIDESGTDESDILRMLVSARKALELNALRLSSHLCDKQRAQADDRLVTVHPSNENAESVFAAALASYVRFDMGMDDTDGPWDEIAVDLAPAAVARLRAKIAARDPRL